MSGDKEATVEQMTITGIMGGESGRKLMYDWMMVAGTFSNTFRADTHEHARQAGKREIGLHIDRELREACPDQYFKMMKENTDERRRD